MQVTKTVKRVITISLMSFPLHELEWLSERFHSTKTEVISDAIIHLAGYWKEIDAKIKLDKTLDK